MGWVGCGEAFIGRTVFAAAGAWEKLSKDDMPAGAERAAGAGTRGTGAGRLAGAGAVGASTGPT